MEFAARQTKRQRPGPSGLFPQGDQVKNLAPRLFKSNSDGQQAVGFVQPDVDLARKPLGFSKSGQVHRRDQHAPRKHDILVR